MIPALRELGERFSRKEALVPDLLVGARAMQSALNVIEPLLAGRGHGKRSRVCIGTVQGDHHDIGKNIVVMMLRASGYDVDDIGASCGADRFVEAVSGGARAVLCSMLITSCGRHLEEIVERFVSRPDIPVIIGGAAVNEGFAREIGAFACGADANDAARILDGLVESKRI